VANTYNLDSPRLAGDILQYVGSSSGDLAACTIELTTGVVTAMSLGLAGWDLRSNVALRTDGGVLFTGYDPSGESVGGLWATGEFTPVDDSTGPILAPSVVPNPVTVGQSAVAEPGATDPESGIAASGCAAVDTSTAGSFLVECWATNGAGLTTTSTVGYDVVAAAVTVSLDDVTVAEDAGAVATRLLFRFSAPLPARACMRLRFIDGTATRGADHRGNPGRACFPAGTLTGVTGLKIVNDKLVEDDETFEVELYDLENVLSGDTRSTWTILDDDRRRAAVTVSLDDVTVAEDAGVMARRLVFNFSEPLPARACLRFRFIDGTATRPADYRPKTGRTCFRAGTLTATTTIRLVNDKLVEDDETFEVELYDLENVLPGQIRSTWTIIDDD
jgi:hypothetical protein